MRYIVLRYLVFISALLCIGTPALAQMLTGPASPQEMTTEITEPLPSVLQSIQTPAPASEKQNDATPDQRGQPLEITADDTLEWKRDEKTFTARGNAVARQGDTSISADSLTAHYTDKKSDGMEISRVEANDNVTITARDSTAQGQKADYDLMKGYAVMTGNNLKMISPDQTVTATEKFEYHVAQGQLKATGKATVIRGNDTLQADVIAAVMKQGAGGKRVLESMEATGHVVIKTPTETARGDRAIYNAGTDKAELKGNVKIARGPNILEGDRAEVDLTTNTSRLFGNPAIGGGRVRGVFYPGSEKKP